MKAATKWAVIGLAFAAGGAFAQGRDSQRMDPRSTAYWSTPAAPDASRVDRRAVNGPIVTTPQFQAAPGPTMGPYTPGDDIRNANSALWGV